ncbi:hypothetical protein SELMODRAFT_140066 [Selaginella moellendorffii]|uniref:Uncharacterized protein n=1 Tax=Selaginella moellendorffii TaxID=88036 RepID=D8QNJ2_SELML|nr:hypothetical protein SELMODRAFT_140066 [Selaginella moellendorffii]
MSSPQQKWLTGLKSTSLFRAPPLDLHERQTKTVAYVELFGQFASDSFPEDIAELVRDHYPHKEPCLLDDVLATFVLHHPEHGHTILHPLLSCVIDGTLAYSKTTPPFGSFVSVFGVSSERDLTEQWALACGEILRLLTHYNRPIYKSESSADGEKRSSSDSGDPADRDGSGSPDNGRRAPKRLLTPWITDSLLAAPLGTKSDYFRWCGGVLGKYAGGGDLRPPTTGDGKGHGKHPQLLSSTPRWAVANGAAVISSVCDDEVLRYETADLTAAAVPALLLPPPSTSLDEHLVAGLPPLEPFARLFHRYYAIATPGATQRLLLGLLEAPASWAPDALDAAVQLVELLRAAEDYSSSSFRLPENWFRLHFLRPMGAAMTMKQGIASDAAAALLFRLFSQPALLFPPRGHAQGAQVVQPLYGPPIRIDVLFHAQMEALATQVNEEATAKGVASLMRDHGRDVEWRICVLWEAAYGLIPLDKSVVDLPEMVIATPLQPPLLSWTLFRPFLRVLEHVPKGCQSQTCLRRIFSATVDAILRRTFPLDDWKEQKNGNFRSASGSGVDPAGMAELRALVHCLFTEAFLGPALASQLLSDALTVCLSHDTLRQGNGSDSSKKRSTHSSNKDRGAVASFDSYLIAAVCALACEVQLCTFSAADGTAFNGVTNSAYQARRLMSVLEGLLVVEPFSPGVGPNTNSPNDLVEAAIVAAHISRLLGRSRACTHALTAIVRCKWDPGVSSKAASILALVDGNDKAVEAVFNYADKLSGDEKRTLSSKQAQKIISGFTKDGVKDASLSLNASDVTNLLCGCNGVSTTVSDLLKAVLKQKRDLAVAIVPLLWQRLMSAEELPTSKEGTSAKQGWRQVVDAVCNVVLTYPEKATSVVLLQAERGIQPWIIGDGGEEKWRMNTRIVFLLSELLRLNDPQVLGLIANAGTLLYQATDGMSVDGEPCTLPQLELLEAIAMAIKSLCAWKVSSRGLLILLKERLPAIVRCLSHDSPRIRASSASLLREIVSTDVLRASYPGDKAGAWLEDVEQSIAWETHYRRAEGLSESFLASAAIALGCKLPPS